ncbi:barstar family protein [Nocardioides sp. AE5]|uniref:barstar family protein n=1 Tax=Nocardioides sp. AE5 TaxID=2962573 RepID=UPI0028810965|nr:barstar family protein [Nocardioides sp. AE5]MDT0201234.1 barstar family protein [Nocardioides sp. AE5]
MSGLAGLLAGHDAPAVHLWEAAFPPEEVAAAVDGAGWSFGYVDGWRDQEKRAVLAALGEALGFPAYYGRNLDALADCLADLEHDTVLLWDGWATLARGDHGSFTALLEVLAERTRATGPRFAVLLRGRGPELPGVTLLQ